MKKAGLFLLILFLSCNFAWSQDTLYIYRAGIVVVKRAVSETDSITFSKNYNPIADSDGNIYHSVKIGEQTWMVENLKTTHYRNGDLIPYLTDNNSWVNSYNGAYCWYNNDIKNKDIYGALYNGYTISDDRNIAPIGWHVPTMDEWTALMTYLGGDTLAGGKLKESGTKNWNSPNTSASNESGFTALPGGQRNKDTGLFNNLGLFGYFWNNTQIDTNDTKQSVLFYNRSNFGPSGCSNSYGSSIRCIKNSLASVSTSTPVTILSTTATCGGNVTLDGGENVTENGICWNTSTTPTITNYKKSVGAGIGAFSTSITGLTPNTTYYVRAYATNNLGTAYGYEMSFKTLPTDTLTVTDIDGNLYHTVTIGTQTWMVENLKTSKYRNGDIIPNVTNSSLWSSLTTGGWCFYKNDSIYNTKYCKLYNWYSVNDNRNIAPLGWHVPNDTDWALLTTYLGGESVAGGKLKEVGTINWKSPNVGATNETNFFALPSGGRGNDNGTFLEMGISSFWWSSTELNSFYAYFRSVGCNGAGVGRSGSGKMNGLAVRCIKDVKTLPILITSTVSSITDTSAISGGNITSNGGAAISARGICWSTSQNPTITGSKTTDSTEIGAFTSKIAGLTADSTYYVRAYATNSVGTAYGNQISFKTLNAVQTVTDVDGNVYHTVKIGNQTWMVENLKTTKYNDGTTIPLVTDGDQWVNLSTPAYCWINNDISYKDVYGAIYNFYTVSTGKLAPVGWHVPTDSDWTTLTSYLGGLSVCGSKLKETGTVHWSSPNSDATNTTGFTSLPGGYRTTSSGGAFVNQGSWGCYWSSTLLNGSVWRSIMASYNGTLDYKADNLNYGFNVRCIKN